jgi:hypothetical protein
MVSDNNKYNTIFFLCIVGFIIFTICAFFYHDNEYFNEIAIIIGGIIILPFFSFLIGNGFRYRQNDIFWGIFISAIIFICLSYRDYKSIKSDKIDELIVVK